MSVEKGKSYSWFAILKEFDAENTVPPYALHRDDRVIGFALNRWQNPKAPLEILVRNGPERERHAEIFIAGQPVVPVLIKENETDNEWRCVGHFKLQRVSDEPAEKDGRLQPPEITAIYKILFLTEVPDQP
jgi:hypothetical protein